MSFAGDDKSLNDSKVQKYNYLVERKSFLHEALINDLSNFDYHFELANVYAALYDLEPKNNVSRREELLKKSAWEFEQSIMLRPDDVASHYNLGVVYKRMGEMERARESFKKVLSMRSEPKSLNAIISTWIQIGSIYEAQGFFDEAKDAYIKAQELNFEHPDIDEMFEGLENEKQKWHKQMYLPLPKGNFVKASDYAEYGKRAAYSKNTGAGVGAIMPIIGALLVQEFIQKNRTYDE